jgi:hypothetical protein
VDAGLTRLPATLEPRPTASDEAAEAVRLVLAEPRAARDLAAAALERAEAEGDAAAASTAERALGLAAKELRDSDAALGHFRRAIAIAERASLAGRAGEARMSLSLVLAYRGDTRGALREADLAARVLRGHDAARLEMQRALILQRLGRLDEALEGYKRALRVFRRKGDGLWEARLLNNRGLLLAYRGALAAAQADLERAERLHVANGQELAAAEVRGNLGFVAGRRGDIPAALHWFDLADDYFRAHGVPRAVALVDRCQLLLQARLTGEGRRAGEQAVEELERSGMAADLAEARLMLSEAALLDGDLGLAAREAEQARRAFVRQRRREWAALAAYASLRVRWTAGERTPATLAAARRLARTLPAAGWTLHARDAGLIAARIALELGRTRAAQHELARAAEARTGGPVELRVRAWHAEALLRHAAGRPRAAGSALRAGLRLLDEHRAALGATELRAHVSSHAEELAAFGLRLALDAGDAAQVLAWSERWRAGSLHLRPVRPPDDALLAADLAELRGVVAAAEQAALAGGDAAPSLRRQLELEERIQRRTRRAPGRLQPSLVSPPSPRELSERLGERALVAFVKTGGSELHAVTVARGRVRLRELGRQGDVRAELDSLRFALRRLARRHGSERSLEAAALSAQHACARLEELLFEPIRPELGDRPLVIVPTGALHALPWSVLPTGAGRPVTVAPSAALWLRADSQPPDGLAERAVLVAGPGLPGAETEVGALATRYPSARRLTGAAAGADSVRDALDGAALAHVAAHGSFRADNPLFSSLRLWDGPLTVYDLESLERAPRLLVLSACDSGLSGVHPGDELMGLASALLALGTRTLIGSVVPVADEATSALMVALHEELGAGSAPAEALARAQVAVADAAAGFVCIGAG